MNAIVSQDSAVTTPTRFVETRGRKIAYRSIGAGSPLIFCVRFRGVLDVWDPAFLDALAARFRVITFDYTGLGRSTGEASYNPKSLAQDVLDLADALGIDRFAVGGWSLGGMGAQTFAVLHPERVTHLLLIGAAPPGPLNHAAEQVFYDRALKFDNDLADEEVLFFEPASERSRAAAKASNERIAARTVDRSPVVPEATYLHLLQENAKLGDDPFVDQGGYRDFLAGGSIPILVISGDHEIVFPVHNWFELARVWTSLHLLVIPSAGHGPHHQEPRFCADAIISFVDDQSEGAAA